LVLLRHGANADGSLDLPRSVSLWTTLRTRVARRKIRAGCIMTRASAIRRNTGRPAWP